MTAIPPTAITAITPESIRKFFDLMTEVHKTSQAFFARPDVTQCAHMLKAIHQNLEAMRIDFRTANPGAYKAVQGVLDNPVAALEELHRRLTVTTVHHRRVARDTDALASILAKKMTAP